MSSLKNLFSVDVELSKRTKLFISILGWCLLLGIWWLITAYEWINPYILPSPQKVFGSYAVLLSEKELISQIGYSVSINLLGYIQAVVIAIPLGFILWHLYNYFKLFFTVIHRALNTYVFIGAGMLMARACSRRTVKVLMVCYGISVSSSRKSFIDKKMMPSSERYIGIS